MKGWGLVLLWALGCTPRTEPTKPVSPGENTTTTVPSAVRAGAAGKMDVAETNSATEGNASEPNPGSHQAEDVGKSASRATLPHRALSLTLTLNDVPPSLLTLPAGAVRVPLVVSAHGAGGSPEWDCEWLTHLTDGHTALLCLRGLPLGRGQVAFYYPEHHSLGRWLDASLAKTRTDHAERLDGTFIYVGYSQGATMGALALQTHPTPIPHVILVEGGLEGWSQRRASQFRNHGGRSVTFVCGTRSCDAKARKLQSLLRRVGLEVQVHHAVGAGHTSLGEVSDFVRKRLNELFGASGSGAIGPVQSSATQL